MPVYNFTFKIEVGKKKKPKVELYATTVNPKKMFFPSGFITNNNLLARFLKNYITFMLSEVNEKPADFSHIDES